MSLVSSQPNKADPISGRLYHYFDSIQSIPNDFSAIYPKHFKKPGRKPSGEVEGAYTRVRD